MSMEDKISISKEKFQHELNKEGVKLSERLEFYLDTFKVDNEELIIIKQLIHLLK